jgi:signal transduction histidine kinase
MLHSALRRFDKRRLRMLLFGFFLALALPTAVLVYQAWSQLKWEAFYQHRLLAEELAERIDSSLTGMIASEEARSFGDYSFLVLAGDPAANFLQRSPLSDYPSDSPLPGLLAYFQVDADGGLSTPLVPEASVPAGEYGISDAELAARVALENQIRQILSENRLVEDRRMAELEFDDGLASMRESKDEFTGELQVADRADEPAAPTAFSANAPVDQLKGQAAFDELNEPGDSGVRAKKQTTARALGRVEDLQLEEAYAGQDRKLEQAPAEGAMTEQGLVKRARRREQAAVPEPAREASLAGSAEKRDRDELRVSTFESEIDPFEFSLLDSGHFVLFRKVWRDGQRYIQGAVIEQVPFFAGTVEAAFRGTALSRMSNLIMAWRGSVLEVFTGQARRDFYESAEELTGALLYQTRLSAPLDGLEMIISINQLPAGPGATVVGWVAVILGLVLCGGFLIMYRLGLGQIELAAQQQDFVSAVSHELKTPLTSIRMYGEMLQSGWVDEQKRQTYYAYIHDESERLSRLIENVLQLARMTRNDPQFDVKPVSVGELMALLRSRIGSQIERAGFTLTMNVGDEVSDVAIGVDTDCFTQIVINLVDNAIKFAGRSARKAIDIGAALRSDGGVRFTVRDYGPGISRGQMKKVFRLFYRAENELTRETVGTGIGLALVQQLVAAMDGSVDVTNRNPGAEFSLSFPASAAALAN